MHKLKILSISVGVLVVLVAVLVWVQPEPSIVKDLPETEVAHLPVPDFTQYDNVVDKKQAFFDYLRPEVEAQNDYILTLRDFIHQLRAKHVAGKALSEQQSEELQWLMKEYRVKPNKDLSVVFANLLRKIDILPVELVLVQTANESAWGTSRFATQGYNFFGLWCFKKGCGFVPRDRNDGAAHEVAKFDNLSTAMYTYMRNLNRLEAYRELRLIRQSQRKNMKPITATALAEGLHKYSERGDDYIEELKQMIRINKELIANESAQ